MIHVLMGDQDDIDVWIQAIKGQVSPGEWKKFFIKKKFASGVDFPFSLFYKELMEAFPNAKVQF